MGLIGDSGWIWVRVSCPLRPLLPWSPFSASTAPVCLPSTIRTPALRCHLNQPTTADRALNHPRASTVGIVLLLTPFHAFAPESPSSFCLSRRPPRRQPPPSPNASHRWPTQVRSLSLSRLTGLGFHGFRISSFDSCTFQPPPLPPSVTNV